MRVFLSSTYLDLREYRKLVATAIESIGSSTSRMEVFGARSEEPREASLKEVAQCDVFVGIYAHRYGYVPPGSKTSITEQEFREAKHDGKPAFCFLVDDDHPWPPKLIESAPGKTSLEDLKGRDQNITRSHFLHITRRFSIASCNSSFASPSTGQAGD